MDGDLLIMKTNRVSKENVKRAEMANIAANRQKVIWTALDDFP